MVFSERKNWPLSTCVVSIQPLDRRHQMLDEPAPPASGADPVKVLHAYASVKRR